MAEPQDIRRAYDLIAEGRADAALELTLALNAGPAPSEAALSVHAVALTAARRPTDALAVNRIAVQRYGSSRVAWHNLAATLGDLGQAQEAEASARKAMALGLGAPETRLVLARALQAQQRFDEAQATFAEAIALRPDFNDAHRDLAQLIWMRTADRTATLAGLRKAVAAHPANMFLRFILATAQEFTGDKPGARATLADALKVDPQDRILLSLMVRLCCETGDAPAALAWAQSAARAHRCRLPRPRSTARSVPFRRQPPRLFRLRRIRPRSKWWIAAKRTEQRERIATTLDSHGPVHFHHRRRGLLLG